MKKQVKALRLFLNSILKRDESRKIFENIFWLFSDKILRYGVGLFVSIWVANYLGAARFGNYNVAVAYMFIFSALSTLGLKGVVTRELVKHPEKENDLLGSAFFLTIVGSLSAFLLAVLTSYILSPDDREGQILVAVVSSSLLLQGAQVFNYYYSAKVLSKYIVYSTNASYLFSVLLKVYGVWVGKSLTYFAWVIFCDAGLSALLLASFFFYHKKWTFSWRVVWSTVRELLVESLPLILSGIMVSIYMKVDQIMLKEMFSDEEAGLYAVAVKLTELWYFIPVIIQSSVFPNLTNTQQKNKGDLYKKFAKLFSFITIFSAGVILGTLLFGKIVLSAFFSEEYTNALPMLYVSIFSLLFVGLGVVRNSFLLIEDFVVYTMYFTTLGAVLNIGLNLHLIPHYGGIGAAISTVVSYAVSALFSTFLVKKLRPLGRLMIRSVIFPKFNK